MRILRIILAELVHLFADDGWLATGLLAWTAVIGLAIWLPTGLPPTGCAAGLFLGCAAVLLSNVTWARSWP